MTSRSSLPQLTVANLDALSGGDALVLVGQPPFGTLPLPMELRIAIDVAARVDPPHGRSPSIVACEAAPGGRLVLAPTGDLAHWTNDVRRYREAALAGTMRALAAGARRPVVMAAPHAQPRYAQAPLLAALGALQACWRHPQIAARGAAVVDGIALAADGADRELGRRANALNHGLALTRDLTAGDPEFMAPEPFAAWVEKEFAGSQVQVTVERDTRQILRSYPLLGAVARASLAVARHHPRVVKLRYDGGGGRSLFFAGKGVTYDTGGADLKVGGAMAGMSKDKGGAAAVAGFFAVLAALRPQVRATAYLGLVRNSIGPDSYVSDEILTSRAGVPLVIGNTDAEGRMVLADLLAALREEALASNLPLLASLATLTGHVGRAYGPYPAVMANGAASTERVPQLLQAAGEQLGDPFEHSPIRREDYEMVAARGINDVMPQCNTKPSVDTPRGHQFPFCFLERAAALEQHDKEGALPLPWVHLDISAAAVHKDGPMAGQPSGSPVLGLAGALLDLV